MAYNATSRLGYRHPQADSTLATKRSAFLDNDDPGSLDPSLLEADMMPSPNEHPFRKDSFALSNNGVLSPAESHTWEAQFAGPLSLEAPPGPGSHVYHDDISLHLTPTNPQQVTFAQPHSGWGYDTGSGHVTPTGDVKLTAPPLNASHYMLQRSGSAHADFAPPPPPHLTHHYQPAHPDQAFMSAPQVQTPISPHARPDWMGMAQQDLESRPLSKRPRLSSVSPHHPSFERQQDGIRKKNGRIDIPADRDINTIEEMIHSAKDEGQIKELKAQKRLLRNREAALASRQRKKKHTEELEVKEKNFAHQIQQLQVEKTDVETQCEYRESMIKQISEQYHIHREAWENEKSEMINAHNEETKSLRRKILALTEQVEATAAPIMSAAPSSTGFTEFNAEMEALNMGATEWDQYLFANQLEPVPHDDFSFDLGPPSARPASAVEQCPVDPVPNSNKKGIEHASEQPVAPALVFMLLLWGAWVASQPASARPADMPKMPADVCAAAPTVLNSLLSDVAPIAMTHRSPVMSRWSHDAVASPSAYAASKPGRLDRLHRTLTTPSAKQEVEQAYTLTPAQYASLTDMQIPLHNRRPASSHLETAVHPPQRTLAKHLASLDQDHAPATSNAEVYTRSLLWDQIPAQVVQQFREMVRDHDEIDGHERRQQPPSSHDFGEYKLEP